jgi:hypothetical protein
MLREYWLCQPEWIPQSLARDDGQGSVRQFRHPLLRRRQAMLDFNARCGLFSVSNANCKKRPRMKIPFAIRVSTDSIDSAVVSNFLAVQYQNCTHLAL